jgi:hypothetical protein
MTTPGGGPLTTDFDLMTAVAGKTDARNEEIRAMLQSFIVGWAACRHRCGEVSLLPFPRRRRAVERGVDETSCRSAADCGDHSLQRGNPA